MANPSYVNAGTVVTTGSGTSLAPTLPGSRTNNNLLIAFVAVNATGKTFSVGGGWTVDETVNTTHHSVARVSRLVDGTEAAPTISWTGNAAGNAWIAQFTGNAAASYFGNSNSAQGNSGAALSSGTLTTTADNSLVARICFETSSVVILEDITNYTKNSGFTNTNISQALFSGIAYVSGSVADDLDISSTVGDWSTIAFEIIGTGSAPANEPAIRATHVVQQALVDTGDITILRATHVVQQVLVDTGDITVLRSSQVVLQVLRSVTDAPAVGVRNKAMLLLRCGG